MPELSRFFGIIIQMFFNDTKQHFKPHIHAKYGGFEAAIGIEGELLDGSMPQKQLTLIRAWCVLHEDELYNAWNNAVRYEAVNKIPPLRK